MKCLFLVVKLEMSNKDVPVFTTVYVYTHKNMDYRKPVSYIHSSIYSI